MKLPRQLVEKTVKHVNRKNWWHVPPVDPNSYSKRGKFLASSFTEAEFWGRPLGEPQRVNIFRPLIGDEPTIESILFGRVISRQEIRPIEERFALDAMMKKVALARGFDSIVLMTPKGFSAFKKSGKLPRSMELNILDPG